jgi:hypothetical protein
VSKLSINGSVARRRKEQIRGKRLREGGKQKVIERRERCVKQEEAIDRKLALVAQEIKADQEPHYHDDEKQRKSDNVTDIHDWKNSRALLIILCFRLSIFPDFF